MKLKNNHNLQPQFVECRGQQYVALIDNNNKIKAWGHYHNWLWIHRDFKKVTKSPWQTAIVWYNTNIHHIPPTKER